MKENRSKSVVSFLPLAMFFCFFAEEGAWAEVKKSDSKASSRALSAPAVTQPKVIRKKELDFEERIIEGLTDRGLESFTQTGTIDPISKEKLYRKRDDFEDASKALLREMEYLK